MTLSAGSRLGPYEILSPLGAGGMGEVYLARDTRLGRTVAVKVLPQRLSSDPELRRRFEREARAISQLSHPHICALYDVGREGDTEYLVMEHLEGETLAARIAAGPLPLEQTLRFGSQIAEALERAHRAGIVHRDLKPSNVMLTKAGVKLLDFGLARKSLAAGRVADLTSAPTDLKETELTGQGTIAGTLQYMAPEQLEGKEPDHRTDIFAFGTVLYEMATGKKAFTGSSQASLITSIMSSQPPPIESVQPMTPPLLDRAVRRCLARDPDERWQSAADVAAALRWIGEGETGELAASAPAKSRRTWLPWSAAALFLLLALLAIWKGRRPAAAVEPPTRFLVEVPSSAYFLTGPSVTGLAASPDGRRIAFIAGSGTKNQLWIRSLDAFDAVPLPGTEGALAPFWSPDGRQVGFFARGGKLQRVAASGGPPQTICESGLGNNGTWGPGGIILFSETGGGSGAILRVLAEGGSPIAITKPDPSKGERAFGWPHFLPDGRHFLLLKGGQNLGEGVEKGIVCLGSLDSSEVKPLFEADSRVEYAPPGYLLFVRDAVLMAQPFDPQRLTLSGDAVPVAPAIWYFRHTGAGAFSASSRANLLVYQLRPYESRLVWLDRGGRAVSTIGEPAIFSLPPRLSPDGRRIAAPVRDPRTGKRDLWIYDAATGLPTRQTFEGRDAVFPAWSPDGSRIAYASFREGPPDIYVRDLASGRDELLVKLPGAQLPNDWSRDGARIAYRDMNLARQPSSRVAIVLLGAKPAHEPTPGVPFDQHDARFSPDGRWMSLVSEESGEAEVYVVPVGGAGERRRVSSSGGDRPRWRSDGRELYFLSKDRRLMAVPVTFGTGRIELGDPRAVFSAGESAVDYDPAPNGERFLFVISSGRGGQPPLVVNLNWAAGLSK